MFSEDQENVIFKWCDQQKIFNSMTMDYKLEVMLPDMLILLVQQIFDITKTKAVKYLENEEYAEESGMIWKN